MAAAGPLPDNYAVETFKNWARLRNGKFTETFTDDVTHLLCSVDQYNSQGPIGSHATTPTSVTTILTRDK